MAKERYVNTKFWDDNYIVNLDPIEKLLFLYFLTNPLTNIAGVYEITLKRMAFDTGIDKDMIMKILGRFEAAGKVKYSDGWIAIKNFIKHQKKNPKITAGIKNELLKAPRCLVDWIQGDDSLSIDYDSLSHSNTNTNTNTNIDTNTQNEYPEEFQKFWQEYPRKKEKKKAFRCWKTRLKEGYTADKLILAAKNYAIQCAKKRTQTEYIKHPSTFLGPDKPFEDYLTEVETQTNDATVAALEYYGKMG